MSCKCLARCVVHTRCAHTWHMKDLLEVEVVDHERIRRERLTRSTEPPCNSTDGSQGIYSPGDKFVGIYSPFLADRDWRGQMVRGGGNLVSGDLVDGVDVWVREERVRG